MSERKERFLTYFSLNSSKKEKLATSSSYNESFPSNSSSSQNEQDIFEDQTKPEETIPNWTDASTSLHVEKFERIDLKTYKSETELIDKKFSIMLLVDSVLKYMRNPETVLEYDDQVPLVNGSHILKGKWTREFYSICNKNRLSKDAQDDILNLIYNTWGHISNLPLTLTTLGRDRLRKTLVRGDKIANTDCDENSDADDDDEDDDSISDLNASSQAKKYVRKGSRWIQFQQCQNDCCVFVGRLANKLACPRCSSPRHRPCTRSKCEGKGKNICQHLLMDGVAYKNLHYRLLVPLIVDLVSTKYFVTALHYHDDLKIPEQEDYYTDILDGSVAKEHLDSMDKNYKAWCTEKAANAESTPINLLLSQFYDGGQLFKWTTCNFWGLFTSILNLPPTYRGKLGIATFLSAIYGGKHTTVERFLFTDLYCEELRFLYEGFEYVGVTGKRFFIQARLILHSMDTKALEPVFNLKSMTFSRYGCPYCRTVHGQFNSWTSIYGGNRQFLDEFHYLRFFGQSGLCCPAGFYDPGADWFVPESFKSSEDPILAENLHKRNMEFCMPCDKDATRCDRIKSFLRDKNSVYEWHHKDPGFDFKDISTDAGGMRNNIFYRHFDFRPQKEQRRITKEEYMESACQARDLNLKRKRKEEFSVHGLKGVWPFDRLPYADFAKHSTFPPEHAIEGVVVRCYEFVFGIYKERIPSKRHYPKKKKLDDGSAQSDVNTMSTYVPIYRPSYHDQKPPYSCTNAEKERCRSWLLCALIPVGISDRSDWILDIDKTGIFKISQWKIFISVYWGFILTTLQSIDEWYRKFFDMVGDKIRKLLSFSVAKSSVQQLQKEMNEMICLWESHFPESPGFQVHQLMELVSTIPLFGSQHSWSELFGEKNLGTLKNIKKNSNPGGLSYEKFMINKCVDRELDSMAKFYSKAVNETYQKAPNSTIKVSFDSITEALHFKVMQFALYDSERESSTFYPDEINHFVKLLLFEIRKRYDHNENLCVRNSGVYRLVKSMREQFKAIKTFYEMLLFVVDIKESDLDIFSPNEVALARAIIGFKPNFHRKAWVYGLMFRSRGSTFREKAKGDNEFDWKDKKNYSSWCKFIQTKTSRYAKINAFFEVLLGDDSVDGLLVASVTSYKDRKKAPNILVDIVDHSGSMDDSILFVALQDIYPTRIATIPFGDNHLPINTSQKTRDPKFVNESERQLSYSYMLQMDADKISRMPDKRPYTLYLSGSTIDRIAKARSSIVLPSSNSGKNDTKFLFEYRIVDGERCMFAKQVDKKTLPIDTFPALKAASIGVKRKFVMQQPRTIILNPKITQLSSTALPSLPLIESGTDCCKFCRKSTLDCNPTYTGKNSRSSVSMSVRYSFPWRKNSCSIDSVGSCLQMIYSNLSNSGKTIMEEYCPDLCTLFGNLSDGSILTFAAKEALESLLGDRLWMDKNTFSKFSQHLFESVQVAFKLYSSCTAPLPVGSRQRFDNVPMFISTVTVSNICSHSCNKDVVYTKHESIVDEFGLHLRAKNSSMLTISKGLDSTIYNSTVMCPTCHRKCKTIYSQFQGALVIRIVDYSHLLKENELLEILPDEILLADTRYRLSACIYGDNCHFVTMVRDFSTNRVLICDGMSNDAQFIEHNSSIKSFPAKLFEMRVNVTFFVRSDYSSVLE